MIVQFFYGDRKTSVREEMGEGGEDMQQRTTAWNQPWPAEDSAR